MPAAILFAVAEAIPSCCFAALAVCQVVSTPIFVAAVAQHDRDCCGGGPPFQRHGLVDYKRDRRPRPPHASECESPRDCPGALRRD